MNTEEFVDMWIEECELNVGLDFVGQDMPPWMQFATITRILSNYQSSLKLNLDTSQSLYRVGMQVSSFDVIPELNAFFLQILHLRSENLSRISKQISKGSFFQVLLPHFIETELPDLRLVARHNPLAAPFLFRVLPVDIDV
jgi:hypothetical protein